MLRKSRGLSQADLATLLQVRQAAVSRLEGRRDQILVRSLYDVVRAMGGELRIRVRFPDGMERDLSLARDDDGAIG
jgi:transcriptional regulator with XRE-family HTH domain